MFLCDSFAPPPPPLRPPPVPLPGGLCYLLLQPGGGQSPAGPEEARETSGALPASVPGVVVQQEAGPVELPGSPSEPLGQIPPAAEGDTEVHTFRPPGRGHAASRRELESYTFVWAETLP